MSNRSFKALPSDTVSCLTNWGKEKKNTSVVIVAGLIGSYWKANNNTAGGGFLKDTVDRWTFILLSLEELAASHTSPSYDVASFVLLNCFSGLSCKLRPQNREGFFFTLNLTTSVIVLETVTITPVWEQ